MQKYFNTILDEKGDPIGTASVLVKTPAGDTATIYADNSGTTTGNPLSTSSTGYFEFYAPNGLYTIVASKTGKTTVTIENVLLDDPVQPRPTEALLFHDTFSRTDTTAGNLGTSDNGRAWDLRGPYVSGYPLPASAYGTITNGVFVADPACTAVYATQTFTETVTRIGAMVSWSSSSGVQASTFAMIISLNSNFVSDMIHFTINRATWALQVREAGGAFVNLLTGTSSTTLATDGTVYPIELIINGRSATVNIAGKLSSIYDSRIPNNIGKYCVWEHFYNSNPSLDLLRIHSVWAGASPNGEYIGNARHIAASGVTEFQGQITALAAAINCVGTDSVESTITALPPTTATGSFRRARIRILDHTALAGWSMENIGDGTNYLRFQSVSGGTGTTRFVLSTRGAEFFNIQNSITAFAGGGQASATALTGQLCRITVCATAGDSVKLPAATGTGLMIIVINSTANSANVFPSTGGAIDALAADTALAVAAGKRTTFYDVATNLWIAVPGA